MAKIKRSNCIQGFVFKDGRYDKPYVFLRTPENIVRFLLAHTQEQISLADVNYHDLLQVDDKGQIDTHFDQSFYDEIRPVWEAYKAKEMIRPLAFKEFASERLQNEIADQIQIIQIKETSRALFLEVYAFRKNVLSTAFFMINRQSGMMAKLHATQIPCQKVNPTR